MKENWIPKIMEELKLTGMGKRVSMAANTEKYVRKTESVDKLVSHVVTIAEGSKDEPTLKLAYKKCFDFLGQNRLIEE